MPWPKEAKDDVERDGLDPDARGLCCCGWHGYRKPVMEGKHAPWIGVNAEVRNCLMKGEGGQG